MIDHILTLILANTINIIIGMYVVNYYDSKYEMYHWLQKVPKGWRVMVWLGVCWAWFLKFVYVDLGEEE